MAHMNTPAIARPYDAIPESWVSNSTPRPSSHPDSPGPSAVANAIAEDAVARIAPRCRVPYISRQNAPDSAEPAAKVAGTWQATQIGNGAAHSASGAAHSISAADISAPAVQIRSARALTPSDGAGSAPAPRCGA